MSRVMGVAFGLLALLVAGCGVTSVVIDDGGVADQPSTPDIVGKVTLVAEGEGGAGPYRAWVFRTAGGLTCLEVATSGQASSGCGSGIDAVIGASTTSAGEARWLVAGGTRQPATEAVVHTADGADVRAPVAPAPPGVTDGVRFFVVGVAGAPPETLDLLDAEGNVLESRSARP